MGKGWSGSGSAGHKESYGSGPEGAGELRGPHAGGRAKNSSGQKNIGNTREWGTENPKCGDSGSKGSGPKGKPIMDGEA